MPPWPDSGHACAARCTRTHRVQARIARQRGSVRGARITRFGRRFRLGAAAGVPLRDVQIAVRRAGPGTTTICGRGSENSGRPAAAPGVVVASAAGG